jgi:polyisoprenoid-binding protein YceI
MKRLVVAVVLLAGVAGFAQAANWKPDYSHSSVTFSVSHMVLTTVHGRFQQFDATLTQEGEDFAGASVEAEIKTASVSTDNERRDNHLRSDDFFNAEKYPTITFKSTAFEPAGDHTYKITGNLTIRDVTKEIVLNAKETGRITDQRGKVRVGFQATTTINRFDYGVKWDKTLDTGGLVAGNEVTIELNLEFIKQ